MASNFSYRFIGSNEMPNEIDNMMRMSTDIRRNFERRWYDNNFFDDGFHFRYVSRSTGKIIDVSDHSQSQLPVRAIPKASRQIRGIANLLSSLDPIPVVYPENVTKANYQSEEEYQQAMMLSKHIAKKTGHWIKEEFRTQEIKEKTIQMIILAAKHGVSFMQIWPDGVDEKINSEVFDAFDISLLGNLNSIYKSPFIIKSNKEQITKIRANELFDAEARGRLLPDNKYASSDVKQSYMQARFGVGSDADGSETLLLKEAFVKEYINDQNLMEIAQLAEKTGAMEGRKVGDTIIRHTFSAGGETLLDEYITSKEYPFVDFRFEPGPIYQTPLIERFIPANKSLDIMASRVERYLNTMTAGSWLVRRGEDIQITNLAGGQKIEYTTTPPVQAKIEGIPASAFNFMSFLEQNIEEQGASTAALGSLPDGVKSGVAIESLKATEYDNLRISTDMLKQTTRHIAERFLDIADTYFVNPQNVQLLEEGEPQYFDIIGKRGKDLRESLGERVNAIPVSKEYRVEIEVESGLGYTQQGKKDAAQQLTTFIVELAKQGLITKEAVSVHIKKMMDIFQYGNTQEFMDAIDEGTNSAPLNEQQLLQMKVAMVEAMKDAGVIGPEADQKLVDSTKLGVAEAAKDLGLLDRQNKAPEAPKGPSESISFKDMPVEGKVQMAEKVGITLSPDEIRAQEEDKFKQEQMNKARTQTN